MRSYNVLLLIALVTISFSNAFEFTNLSEVKELRSSSYGNSLIETISLTLQNAGSINDVQKLLDDLLFKLNQDQEESDKAWEKSNKALVEKIETLRLEIEALDRQIALDKDEKADNEKKRDQAVENLKQFNAQLTHNADSLAQNEENRKKDDAEYKKSVQEHADVVNAIEAVMQELLKLQGSVSGVAKPVHVEEIAAETRDAAHAALKNSFVQLTRDDTEAMIFVQMATSADQAALAKLISLLQGLSDSTKKSANDDVEHEEKSLATYKSLKASLEEDTTKLREAVKEQEKNLKTYVDRVAALESKIFEEEKLVASKRTERASTVKERDDKEAQYKADKTEREREREVIKRLQQIVADRLANMSKFLRAQTAGF
jgi:hypothetical protein